MRSKVLVTGANGQLGKTLREISGRFAEAIEFTFLEKSQLDITNQEEIQRYFKDNIIDFCVNCAAYTNVDLAETETDKAMMVNAHAVAYLSKACKAHNTVLIHMSTDYVFDGNSTTPYKENDPTHPINSYGKSKRLGEEHIQSNLSNYFIIRTSWLYSKFNKNFIKTVYSKLKSGHQLRIITTQKGTPTSCVDLSNFIMFLITNRVKAYGIYHFSAIGETTWFDVGLYIAQYFKRSSAVIPTPIFESKASRPIYSVLSNDKVISLTKQEPNRWQDSVDDVLKSLTYD
ncbi:dTDP-4-dehydrorhamnose reductase [Psychroserpens algicola]|uniref:dTDP-4-dehydrorhamnose reductase n=1 Tax=Psychroserpens algicola TaxID=1719034 RepID=UPI001953F2E6|nr:dTDP-4-dehydrorhamnose reductase [Psychroserpens algicola]